MLKVRSLVVFGLVAFAGQAAYGQGEVRSYFFQDKDTTQMVAGPEGFVITDIIVANQNPGHHWIVQDDSGVNTILTRFQTRNNDTSPLSYHLESGIYVAPNTGVRIGSQISNPIYLTISGYIPSSTGNVPAVGAWGLIVMILMIVLGGSMVLRQRRVAA